MMTPTEHTFLLSLLHEYGIGAVLNALAEELHTPIPPPPIASRPLVRTPRRRKLGRRWTRLPATIIEQAQTMLSEGRSKAWIARKLNINDSSVYRIEKRAKVQETTTTD